MRLAHIIATKQFAVTTEFMPPKSPDLTQLVAKVQTIASKVDAVNVPELKASLSGNHPSFRMNPFYVAFRLKERTGVETVFHLTPRDFNKNAAIGILLAAAEANIQNVLVVSGDRYDHKEQKVLSKNVYDFKSASDLIRTIREINESNFQHSPSMGICTVVGADPTAIHASRQAVDDEIRRLLARQDAGADVVQTQPVFDTKFFEFYDSARASGVKIPILAGLIVLRGYEDAGRIEHRFDIIIPDQVKRRVRSERIGLGLARELRQNIEAQRTNGVHVYPREDPGVVNAILED